MAEYLTVDGGTTNTRICHVKDGRICGRTKLRIGAGSAVGKDGYAKALSDGLAEALAQADPEGKNIKAVIASGMIGSEGGLMAVEHLSAPAGLAELSAGILGVELASVCRLPIFFVRGVKCGAGELGRTDIMRGEETELYGLCDKPSANALYVLPGSHSKHIITDSEGRISEFTTYLTGEMIQSLSAHTLLRGSVSLEGRELCVEQLRIGARMADELGVAAALFKTRILDKTFSASADRVYSYFLGVLLAEEIKHVLTCGKEKIIIGGKRVIAEAMAALLEGCGKQITLVDENRAECAPALGAVRIYEYGK